MKTQPVFCPSRVSTPSEGVYFREQELGLGPRRCSHGALSPCGGRWTAHTLTSKGVTCAHAPTKRGGYSDLCATERNDLERIANGLVAPVAAHFLLIS